uniref:Uncharacterized protein n=1 Tax=viral metagenome TaxID=1070528 RepID=A0A6C0BL25_9ZZZZ
MNSSQLECYGTCDPYVIHAITLMKYSQVL